LVTIDGDVAIAMRRAIVHKHALKAAALRVCPLTLAVDVLEFII
jgi:hypothetical protein